MKNTKTTKNNKISKQEELLFELSDLLINLPQCSTDKVLLHWLLLHQEDDLLAILSKPTKPKGFSKFFTNYINYIDYSPLIYALAGGKEEFEILSADASQYRFPAPAYKYSA